MTGREVCYLKLFGVMENGDRLPPCEGALVRCHLIAKQTIKREGGKPMDSRSWVWGCGGPMGNAGHHGMLDSSRTLRLPRAAMPEATEALATELGLGWYLDRYYGERA